MSTLLERGTITPEELLELSDSNRYELVDGQLEEREVSFLSSLIGIEVVFQLRRFWTFTRWER